jgi:predicted RNA-binding Zn-ribbon protein involved in translation (DUF1610 family)
MKQSIEEMTEAFGAAIGAFGAEPKHEALTPDELVRLAVALKTFELEPELADKFFKRWRAFEALELGKEPLPSKVPMLLWCPECGSRHIDEGEWAKREHHTHACQICGVVWRPALVSTVGVRFLPGFKNEAPEGVFG